MSLLNNLFQKSVAENDKNVRFWQDYLNNLKSLDFSVYADKLKVPTLVPIGSRIFFKGDLKHTSEITVALGTDYFVKCSLAQAEVLRNHRIKDAESKLESFMKEKEYLENQLSFTKQNLFQPEVQEIVELYTEEEDKAWRQKHKENVKKFKQQASKLEETPEVEITDDEVWNRLEELELEEELENELLDNYNEIRDKRKDNLFLANEEKTLLNSFKEEQTKLIDNAVSEAPSLRVDTKAVMLEDIKNGLKYNKAENDGTKSKLDLLQQVLNKQNQLEEKLLELKNMDRKPSQNQKDLMSRLDEMEQLDELEDEMDRLDNILETEDVDSDDEVSVKTNPTKLKKSISFADEDDSETIQITFKHSDVDPKNEPYDPIQGISKPSDIYEAHNQLFNKKSNSILKKSKYASDLPDLDEEAIKQANVVTVDSPAGEVYPVHKTIIVRDVMEKAVENKSKMDNDARPTSIFKKRRMQNKS